MNINKSETLSECLLHLTYNKNAIIPLKENSLNIFMGIGLWSVKDGLSEGLPVDVMQMLLSATVIRSQIIEVHREKLSKVIVLIADSMAQQEGAEKEKVSRIVSIYKRGLESLLHLLKLNECTKIVLSSDLEQSKTYLMTLKMLEDSPHLKKLKEEDKVHYSYIRTQTAITHYMNQYEQVGIKIGWIYKNSVQHLTQSLLPQSLKFWDELKFDRWYEIVRPDSTLQYVYTKAGLKHSSTTKHTNVSEGCPYTGYSKDQRYMIQMDAQKDITTICPIKKSVASHWIEIANVCASLMHAQCVNPRLLPEECIKKSHAIATVYNMLNHWVNIPFLQQDTVSNNIPIVTYS